MSDQQQQPAEQPAENKEGGDKRAAKKGGKGFGKRKESPHVRIIRNIQVSKEKEKNMNIKNDKIIEVIEEKQEERDKSLLLKREKEKLKEGINIIKSEEAKINRNKINLDINSRNIINNKDYDKISENNGTQMTQCNLSLEFDDDTFENEKNKNKNEVNKKRI